MMINTRTVLFVIMALCVSQVALAQSSKLTALPPIQSLDLQKFAAQSQNISKQYGDRDPYLDFEVDLPKSFVEQDMNTIKQYDANNRMYGEVFRANGAIVKDVYPYFSVKTYPLRRSISAKNWFVSNILEQGQTLRAIESEGKGDEFEALSIRFDNQGNTEIVRTKGYLKGPRIILAEYVLPTLLWNERRDYQTYGLKSFKLLGRIDNQKPEPVVTYKYLDTFSFQYPSSWRVVAEEKDMQNRIDVSLLTADDLRVVFANLDITLVSDQSLKDQLDRSRYPTALPQIVENRRQKILDEGYLIDDVMERRTYDLAVKNSFQLTEIYPLRRKLSDYKTHRQAPVSKEFWITVVKGTEDNGKNYIVSMMVPSRTDNIDQWAIAAKAYEIILESMR